MKLAKKLLIIMLLLASGEAFGIGAGGYEDFGDWREWFWVFFFIGCQLLLPVVSFIAILAMRRRAKLFHRLIWATVSLVAPFVLFVLFFLNKHLLGLDNLPFGVHIAIGFYIAIVFLPLILLFLLTKRHESLPNSDLGIAE